MNQIPNITRFTNVIRILGQNSGIMTLQGTNSYLIGSSNRRILIDTSDPNKPEYIKLLDQVIKEENITISDIVITHWHHDHIGSLKDIKALKLVDKNCKVWKFPRTDIKEEIRDINHLTDGLEFVIDDENSLKVYHTPGHTVDHAILFDEKRKIVFSGDCILGEGTAVFEDLYDYMKSLEKILSLKPDVIYPAHGNVINDAVKKIQFYIDHRNERERQIMKALSDSNVALSTMEIVKIVYATTPENLWPAAAVNVEHHLEKLKKEGKVVEMIEDEERKWQINISKI